MQDPALYLARARALRGDRTASEVLWKQQGYLRVMALTLLTRIATWYGDRDELERCAVALRHVPTLPDDAALALQFAGYVLGDLVPAAFDELFARLVPVQTLSARGRSNAHQVMVEAHLARGYRTGRATPHDRGRTTLTSDCWVTVRCSALRDSPGMVSPYAVRPEPTPFWNA